SPDLKEHSDELLQLAEPYVVLAGVSEGLQLNRTAKAARRQEMKDKLAIGAGRIGFVPDLPPHILWPATEAKTFMFLSQINLSAEWRAVGYLPSHIPSITGTPTQNPHHPSHPGHHSLLPLTSFSAGNIYSGDGGRV